MTRSAICGASRGPGLVAQQPVDPGGHEPLLPAPHTGFALAGAPHDLDGAETIGSQRHDPRPPDMLLQAVPVGHYGFEASPIGGACSSDDILAHPPDSR